MIITIKRVEEATKGDRSWKVIFFDKDGEERAKNIFLADKYPLLQPGATIEIIQVKSGQYWDITDIKPVTEQDAVQKAQPATYSAKSTDRNSIERQQALIQAVKFVTESDYKGDVFRCIQTADIFDKWLSGELEYKSFEAAFKKEAKK
uniref:Uncharacterized protein n=1 Tax=viral metagenome TaxID=1070528 RepID=A0A6M3KZK5_9ZZZZ